MSTHSGDGLGPGDLLVRVGCVLFLVGAVAVFVDVLPHPLSHQNRPLSLNLLAYGMGLGLGLALLGLLRMALAGRVSESAEDEQSAS